MKTKRNLFAGLVCAFVLAGAVSANAAMPPEWQHVQDFSITAPELVKISLPVDTIDAARPDFEDLRVCDETGNELPFLVFHPVPAPKAIQSAKSFQTTLNASTTVITLETGMVQPVDAVTLESPAMEFIKAVRVEGSTDGQNWQRLAQGQMIFRQLHGPGQLRVAFDAGTWRWLRLTVDDQRTQPVPFTGARIHAADVEATPTELRTVTITEWDQNPGVTRLTLNLGAANLDVDSLKIETDEPLFTRQVEVAVPLVSEDSIREQVIARAEIYRTAIKGQPPVGELSVPVENRIHSRELVVLIHNEDSPPLKITGVSVARRPLYLVFMARGAETFHLLTGNKFCAAPHYDLAGLNVDLKGVPVTPVTVSALADNSNYRAPEALAGLEVTGAALDPSAWKFRKPIQLSRGGAEQLELDLDVLAHGQGGFADLRVLHGSNQVPYIIQRTSISRALTLSVTVTNDPKNPKVSRWLLKLPQSNVPLTRLTCTSTTPLFQRNVSLYEEVADERGELFHQQLGSATWTRTPDSKVNEFALPFDTKAQSGTLIVETDNGDNPAIELEKFTAFYPATRVLFKAKADDALYLYYGNAGAPSPSYDLNLVAGELLAADKASATLGVEEQLKKSSSWVTTQTAGSGGILFWGVLAVVVVGLLVVMARLLPKAPQS